MELVIDEVDDALLRDEFLLSVRFGTVRRQVTASKALQQPLGFPMVSNEKLPQSIRFDLLSKSGSAWVVLRPGEPQYRVSFSSAQWPDPMTLTVRAVSEALSTASAKPEPPDKAVASVFPNDGMADPDADVDAEKHRTAEQDAKAYLESHRVGTFFHALLHAIIRDRPQDPYAFMAEQLPQRVAEVAPDADDYPVKADDDEEAAKLEALVAVVAAKAAAAAAEELRTLKEKIQQLTQQVQELTQDKAQLVAKLDQQDEGRSRNLVRGRTSLHNLIMPDGSELKLQRSHSAEGTSKAGGMRLVRRPTFLDDGDPEESQREAHWQELDSPKGRNRQRRGKSLALRPHDTLSPDPDGQRGDVGAEVFQNPPRLLRVRSEPGELAGQLHQPEQPLQSVSFTKKAELKIEDRAISKALDNFWSRLHGQSDPSDEFRLLRQSLTTGRWTLYTAGGKATKPTQYSSQRSIPQITAQPTHETRCPFCIGNEHKTPNPLLFFDADGVMHEDCDLKEGWLVRVIPNIFPLLVTPPGLYDDVFTDKLKTIPHSAVAEGQHENSVLQAMQENSDYGEVLFRQVNAVGYSEVVIENPVHNGLLAIVRPEQVALGLRAAQARGRVLVQQPQVRQLLYFKQYGSLSGGSLVHPHMQVVTLPLLTPETQNRIDRAIDFHEEFEECAVCQAHLVEPLGSGAHSSRLVHETKNFVTSVPFASNQFRVSIVPKKHSHTWLSLEQQEVEELAYVLQLVMEGIYNVLDDPEYNVYIFSVDQLEEACDNEDAVHWLLEIQPRFPAELGGLELASGIRVISGLPEDWAQLLRRKIEELLEQRRAADRSSPQFYLQGPVVPREIPMRRLSCCNNQRLSRHRSKTSFIVPRPASEAAEEMEMENEEDGQQHHQLLFGDQDGASSLCASDRPE